MTAPDALAGVWPLDYDMVTVRNHLCGESSNRDVGLGSKLIEPPFFPIVYLRGYAGSGGEIEDTVSTPYLGFNLGSTRIRQVHTGEVRSNVFESPVIRLMKDHGYVDAYHDGQILPRGPVPGRSIRIFRYYDAADEDFGDGGRREIEFHARKLGEFLAHVRDAVLEPGEDPDRFRACLVAHSMGGLICRCYLQNPEVPDLDGRVREEKRRASKGVDKVFTYATPHGGIELRRALRWVEGLRDFVDPNNAGSFGPGRMREFLALPSEGDLRSLGGWFPEDRFFCLAGTDAHDYGAAAGLAKRAVGPLSDGLVRIRNASVLGAPRAFVHRSHSGPYGMVNSESGYQNLRRFFFDDRRVVVEMCGIAVTLPREVEDEKEKGRRIRASYHIDSIVSVRGVPVELNRRAYDEGSALFRTYERLTEQADEALCRLPDGGCPGPIAPPVARPCGPPAGSRAGLRDRWPALRGRPLRRRNPLCRQAEPRGHAPGRWRRNPGAVWLGQPQPQPLFTSTGTGPGRSGRDRNDSIRTRRCTAGHRRESPLDHHPLECAVPLVSPGDGGPAQEPLESLMRMLTWWSRVQRREGLQAYAASRAGDSSQSPPRVMPFVVIHRAATSP